MEFKNGSYWKHERTGTIVQIHCKEKDSDRHGMVPVVFGHNSSIDWRRGEFFFASHKWCKDWLIPICVKELHNARKINI